MEFIFGFVGAIIVGFLTLTSQNATDLDNRSGWRKSMYDLASKDRMTMDDIYRLRASLRYVKKNMVVKKYSFEYMTNKIIDFTDTVLSLRDSQSSIVNGLDNKPRELNDEKTKEKIRIFSRYLLKIHWEKHSKSLYFFNNQLSVKNEYEIGYNTINELKLLSKESQLMKNQSKRIVNLEIPSDFENINLKMTIDKEEFSYKGLTLLFWICCFTTLLFFILSLLFVLKTQFLINTVFSAVNTVLVLGSIFISVLSFVVALYQFQKRNEILKK